MTDTMTIQPNDDLDDGLNGPAAERLLFLLDKRAVTATRPALAALVTGMAPLSDQERFQALLVAAALVCTQQSLHAQSVSWTELDHIIFGTPPPTRSNFLAEQRLARAMRLIKRLVSRGCILSPAQ